MSENNQNLDQAVALALKNAMGQMQGLMQPQQNMAPMQQPAMNGGMFQPQNQVQGGGVPNLTGWSVPVEANINGMVVTVSVSFPAETFPQHQQIIMQLLNMGYPVRGFQKNNGFGGNSGGYNGGGFNRGGYGRRY